MNVLSIAQDCEIEAKINIPLRGKGNLLTRETNCITLRSENMENIQLVRVV